MPCERFLECGHPCIEPCANHDCQSDCVCEPVIREEVIETVSYAKATAEAKKENVSVRSPAERSDPPQKEGLSGDLPLRRFQSLKLQEPLVPESPFEDPFEAAQSYRDFAAGGHVESDKKLAALATKDQAEASQKRLDEASWAGLFGAQVDTTAKKPDEATWAGLFSVQVDTTGKKTDDDVKLVRTIGDGRGGSRGVWKGTMEVPQAKKGKKKWQEFSLLD